MHLPSNVGARRRLKEGRGRPQERAQASLQVDSHLFTSYQSCSAWLVSISMGTMRLTKLV